MSDSTVSIQQDPAAILSTFLKDKKYTQIGILMDEHTEKWCYPLIVSALPIHQKINIRSGEENKTLATCEEVWRKLTDFAFDRRGLLLILGGGVLGDLGGFCAATFKRGIDFALIPTTLLAQVDASIGGKLGIDFDHLKNHIGLFKIPIATLISPKFLKTLPPRELRSGFAEVVKHCLIADLEVWDKVRMHTLADQPWEELIRHSTAFKSSVVTEDPNEKGLRKILNFGHTVGHAAEGYFLSKGDRIFHGEAVALGMVAESRMAFKLGLLEASELSQIVDYLTGVFGPFPELNDHRDLLSRMAQDKKNEGNKLLFALPNGIGKAVWDVEVSEEQVVDAFAFLRSLQT